MKRHPALAPLSRDHHHALVIGQRLRGAMTQTAAATAGAFLAHWDAEQKLHFRLEEEIVLPAYAAYGPPDHPAIIRMLLDHMLIRRDAAALTAAPPLELLHELGARLADHVRFEEQELFPLIEQAIASATPHAELPPPHSTGSCTEATGVCADARFTAASSEQAQCPGARPHPRRRLTSERVRERSRVSDAHLRSPHSSAVANAGIFPALPAKRV